MTRSDPVGDGARAERVQLLQAFDQAPGFVAMSEGPEHRFTFANATYRALIGGRGMVGKTVREALPELESQGFFEILDNVYRSGEPFRGISMPAMIVREAGTSPEERFFDFVYQPVKNLDGKVIGIFVQGVDVTERHTAEERIAGLQRRLDAVLNNASVAIFLMDERQHCAYMNRAAEDLTGYSFAETQGRPLHDVIHHTYPNGDHFPIEACAIDRAFPENANTRGEEVFIHKDGSFFNVAFAASPIRDDASKTIGTIIEVRDISKEKVAQKELEAARAKFEAEAAERSAILGQLAEGVIVTDHAGRITFVNDSARDIHGVAELDVEPNGYAQAYHLLTEAGKPYPPEDLPLARAVLKGETVSGARWRIQRPSGGEVLAVGNAKPIVDANGHQLGAVLTLRDETARAEAERALKESEARLILAIEAGQLAVWEVDVEADTVIGSPELNRLYGFPEDSTPNLEELRSRYAPGELERIREEFSKSIAQGDPNLESEIRHIWPDGTEKWLLMRAQIGRNTTDTATRVVGVVADITRVKQQEARLATVASELRHRLMNTITVISALARRSWPKDSSDSRDDFLTRLRAIGKATDLMFSSRGDPERTTLRYLLSEITGPYKSVRHNPFNFEGPDDVTVTKHMRPLAMAFHELCTNALKYGALSVTEGEVSVRWSYQVDSSLQIVWREMGGPVVSAPERSGLGSSLLKDLLFSQPNSVTIEYDVDGVICTIVIRD